jgi:hypothetical protein
MQPLEALEAFWQAGNGEHRANLIHHAQVVVFLGPVVSHEDQAPPPRSNGSFLSAPRRAAAS